MKFEHENLEVWQLGMDLIDKIYDLAEKYPKREMFNLKAQISKSVTSVPLNISEGSGRSTNKDFMRYVRIAIGSLLETDTNLKIAIRRKYLTDEDYEYVDEDIKRLYFKLIGLEKALRYKKTNRKYED
jgi:four helix bundle protein